MWLLLTAKQTSPHSFPATVETQAIYAMPSWWLVRTFYNSEDDLSLPVAGSMLWRHPLYPRLSDHPWEASLESCVLRSAISIESPCHWGGGEGGAESYLEVTSVAVLSGSIGRALSLRGADFPLFLQPSSPSSFSSVGLVEPGSPSLVVQVVGRGAVARP